MDDQESGLISKKCDSDRSNAFHMLPHTIEDICTQQSMSTNANTDLQFSPIRHVLPQIPTRSSTLRMAISKQTHREMFASSLGSKQDTSSGLGHQLDLSRDRSAAANSDESQDQMPLDVGELIPSWKESQGNENDGQKDPDLSASFQHGRQDQQESSADSNIATSGFHSSSSASNIDSYLMNPDHHHLDQHLPPFSPANKESEGHGKGHSSDFIQKIPGISMGSRLDRNSPQMSSLPNFNSPQPEWCTFDFAKGYTDQSNEMEALEQVVQKVNNPLIQSGHHSQVMPSTRSFESSPNPIKLKIRRDIGAIEQQQLQHSPHPLQQPPQIAPPPTHLSHSRMMLPNHQVPMDFHLHHQQKHLQQQQHSYMYESSRYVQNQGPKDYYRSSGGNGSEVINSSSSAIQKVPNLHFSSDYQDSSARHMSPYSPDQPLSGMSAAFPPGQLQHSHHYHGQQMMSQQLQHQPQYQHYQHHVVAPPSSSALAHRSSTPLSTAMMVLHGASPSPPIFNCPPQGQQSSLQSSQPTPSPSSGAVRPKTGRAKTNAELKKQLMEKRAGQQVRASGDGSSLASSPSPSQIEVSSPRSVSSPQSDSSFGGNSGFQEAPVSLNGMEGQQQQCLQLNFSQYVELTREEMQKSSLLWQLGDLVWARVSGHPWWPAMVVADPITNQFVKLAPRGQKSQYHMQFFGEEQERGWVMESSAINFTGKAAFHEFCQIKLQDNKKDRKAYKIPSQHKKAWEASVRSAEKAFVLSRSERFAQLSTLFFPEYKTKRGGRKPSEDTNKRKSWSDRSSSSDKFAKRSRMETDLILVGGNVEKNDEECSSRDDQHRQPSESSHIVLPKNVSNQHQAQFTVFCRKKRDGIAQENPSWSTTDIDAHLWQQWSQLDDETRSRFIPMGSDFTYLSRMMQNVDVGGGESGMTKQTTMAGKMNGFAGEAPSTKIVSSKNMKAEETRGRKKAGPSSSALKNTSLKHEGNLGMSADNFTNPPIIDEVCFICEKPDLKVVQCTGPCRGLFHRECIKLPPPSKSSLGDDRMMEEEDIICPQCSSKTHKCCECNEELKLTEATTVLCSVTDCGRFYHRACVDIKFFKTPDKLVCPLHSCLTCRVRNKVKDSELILADEEDLDFYECIRCPAAFHIPGVCLATGSKYLAGPFVICSKHFSPTPKTHPLHARFGATWCFTCEKSGGHMLNCESCPAAHHPSCLKISTNPSDLDGWQCPDCIAGINPLHGDVVWVKFGSYRWWPAQIYWPYEVPQNIANLPHEVGEFPVCFFGSRDYLWLNRRRVFPFKVGDKCCREALRKSGGKVFDKAIREAVATYKALKSDPSSSVCATSNIIHLDKNATMNTTEVVDNDDDDDDDDDDDVRGEDDDDDLGGKVKRKRKKLKVPEKDKRVSKPSKRVRSTREAMKDQTKSDSEKQTNQEGDRKEGNTETEFAVPQSPLNTNRSPMMFLSPQIEKDLSELRAKLKMKKPVDLSAFSKKSFPSAARPSKKSGRERSSKGDSTLLSTPSIVSTLINRPLLQSTSLPGVHDILCSWCGLDGQSSCESDHDDDKVADDIDSAKSLNITKKGEIEKKESEELKDDFLINIDNCSKYLRDAIKCEVANCAEEKDTKELTRNEGAVLSDASKEGAKDLDHKVAKLEDNKDHIVDDKNDESNSHHDDEGQYVVTSDGKDASDGTPRTTSEHRSDDCIEGKNEENPKEENKEDDNNNVKAEVTSSITSETDKSELTQEPVDDSNQKSQQPKLEALSRCGSPKNEGFRKRGRLIFCDKGKCSKVYHYKCLRLTKMPHGHWLCPLHQCTICGRASTHQCSKCPNAFCLEHFPHCLSYMDDGSPICTGHPEAPPISEELVADILEEMAITKEAEAGHITGSTGHRKTTRQRGDGDEMDDARVEVPFAKVKKRKRSLSVSSSSSVSSLEHKKKNAKKIKRKKTSEIKDVSFEKRILPSRTQSRERRFLDEDSDNGGRVASDQTLSRKVNEAIEVILPLKEKRLHFKECETALKIKKDKKMKKGIKERVGADEKLNKKGGGRLPVERSETVEAKNIKLPDAVVFLKKEGSAAETFPKRDSEIKKHKSKKLDKDKEHSKKPKDGGSKNREKDGSKGVKIKKKRKSISEDVESRDGNAKHSSKEEKLESQQQETLALLPLRTSGDVPVSSPSFPSRKPSSPGPEVRQHDNPPLVKPSSLLPPPSSPDKSPMFDNSDDEFPELVIDVPM